MIYAARFDDDERLLAYLTENCCRGAAEQCAPSGLQAARRPSDAEAAA